MESKDLKTITIHQGQGDDELVMTVQVTQAEYDKMEEIRSKDPLLWNGKELDLLKVTKELIMKESSGEKEQSSKRTKWKLIIGVVLGIVIIVGTIIFAENINKRPIEVSPQNTSQNLESNDDYSDNIHKLYLDAIERGLTIDEQTFYSRLFESGKSRREVFYDLKDKGMKVNYEEFLNYIGLPIDWQKVLDDFSATKDKYPNLTNDQDWYRMFPEFNNDHNLLQAAFDYDATVKSGKYSDENELKSKFPEFWPVSIDKNQPKENNNLKAIYNKLATLGSKGSYEQFLEYINASDENKRLVYDKLASNGSKGSYEQFLEFIGDEKGMSKSFLILGERVESVNIAVEKPLITFESKQYGFTYQYDKKEFDLVEKINKNTHCVMKLQSPKDEVKSILVSVWENSDFSSAYDSDFIESCQSVDQGMGNVIKSATKTKVGGVNALKSELKINPMGKSYYAAIYRIIHKKRMYMLNIYIPIEEYNKDKSYGDKCANNFKFN